MFDLSKAIVAGRSGQALHLLGQLFVQREEPISVLAVLSNAFADIYRAKIAVAGGSTATALGEDFKSYKGKEFRLRNAARDASRLSVEALRDCLALLADADGALKSGGQSDARVLLEQTVTALSERVTRRG